MKRIVFAACGLIVGVSFAGVPVELKNAGFHETGGKDGAVRFAFCYTPNWLQSRQQPVLPVQGVVKFAELKDGNFMDITRYGVFDKQIER